MLYYALSMLSLLYFYLVDFEVGLIISMIPRFDNSLNFIVWRVGQIWISFLSSFVYKIFTLSKCWRCRPRVWQTCWCESMHSVNYEKCVQFILGVKCELECSTGRSCCFAATDMRHTCTDTLRNHIDFHIFVKSNLSTFNLHADYRMVQW